MYPEAKIGGGGGNADWKAKLPEALKSKVPEGADDFYRDGTVIIFTKGGQAMQGGKFTENGDPYNPTKSENANKPVDSGNGNGTVARTGGAGAGTGAGNGAGGAGGSSSLFQYGFSQNTSGDLGASFINGNYNIDANKFMGASANFGIMSSIAQLMPFGLGSAFANMTMGGVLNGFMKSIGFNFDFTHLNASSTTSTTSTTTEGTSSSESEDGATVNTDDLASSRGYAKTQLNGVYQKDGKYYKYDSKTKEFVECKSDGSDLTTNPENTSQDTGVPEGYKVSRHTDNVLYKKDGTGIHYYVRKDGELKEVQNYNGRTYTLDGKTYNAKTGAEYTAPPTSSTPTSSTPASSTPASQEESTAKKEGYTKLSSGYYRKNGQIYEYKDGEFKYFADQLYDSGRYVKDGKVYDKNGQPSKSTVGVGNAPGIYTIEHYKEQFGYDANYGYYLNGTPEIRNGNNTYYFDNAGRLTHLNNGTTGTRYSYNKDGVVTRSESYDTTKNITKTIEYNLSGLTVGTTTEKGPVLTEQYLDRNGRGGSRKYQAITTVEIIETNGKQQRITTVEKRTVK